MIKKWLIRGDTHGAVRWIKHIPDIDEYKPEEVAIIILGDVSFNFYLDNRDNWRKTEINKYGYQIYCVRGNHEARPTAVKDIKTKFDDAVGGGHRVTGPDDPAVLDEQVQLGVDAVGRVNQASMMDQCFHFGSPLWVHCT